MGSFAFIQGLQTEVDDTPIVDGQLFIKTDLYKMYNDQNSSRKLIGIFDWSKLVSSPFKTIGHGLSVNSNRELIRNNIVWNDVQNKPFKTIGARLNVSNNKLNAKIQDWSEIIKPFTNIGNGLMVDDGVLKIKFEWMHISNKPFNTIGSGLSVTDDGVLRVDSTWSTISNKPFVSIGSGLDVTDTDILISDIQTVTFPNVNTPTYATATYQELLVNNLIGTEVVGTKYLEQTKLLSTANNNVFTFTSDEIKANSVIDIFVDILNFNPLSTTVTNGSCVITLGNVTV